MRASTRRHRVDRALDCFSRNLPAHAMNSTHWSTRRVHAGDRAELWSHINARYFGRLRVGCLDDAPLDATLEAYEVGMLRMYRIEAPAHRVVRDGACGELPIDESYKLVLQVRGRGIVEQHDRRVLLQPGDWVLYDPRSPYSITNHERCTLLVTQVPRTLLGGLDARAARRRAGPRQRGRPARRVRQLPVRAERTVARAARRASARRSANRCWACSARRSPSSSRAAASRWRCRRC